MPRTVTLGPATSPLRRPIAMGKGERMPRRSGWEFWVISVVIALVLIGVLMVMNHFLRSGVSG
jgi:hypothetical protein